MGVTGKTISVTYLGKVLHLCNQRSREWTHPYSYQGSDHTLSRAGCGIFSLSHAVEWMTGTCIMIEDVADFSCANGGRGDDGTDRPALLAALQGAGLAKEFGFRYDGDGLRNDTDTLYTHLLHGGTALCNLRVGHIVALLGARTVDGERQVLAADPYSESADSRVRDNVRECIPGSEIVSVINNAGGLYCGRSEQYALYWATLATVRDFNLLHPISATA